MEAADNIVHMMPSKTKILSKLLLLIIAASGVIEVIDLMFFRYPSNFDIATEITENIIQIVILFLFLSSYVTKPLLTAISRNFAVEYELRKSELNNRTILEAMPDNILHISGDGTIKDAKLEQDEVLDFTVGHNIIDNISKEYVHIILSKIEGALATGETQRHEHTTCMNGDFFHHEFRFVKSGINEVLVVIRNVTNRMIYEQKLLYISTHDALTGLYNRTFFEAELDRLGKSRRFPVGVIVVDLDGLKVTNDTYGHAAGDKLIITAANILKEAVRLDDMTARIGGDEFAILLPETSIDGLKTAVSRIAIEVKQANMQGDGLSLSLSLGAALAETKESLHVTVRHADMEMYRDKASKRPIGG